MSTAARRIGTWSAFTSLMSAAGPVLGGWLAEHASWRWVFFINIPVAALVLAACSRFDELEVEGGTPRIDVAGATLATAGLMALVYGLIEENEIGFVSRPVVVWVISGVALLGAFVVVERRVRYPLVPGGVFRSRTFVGANALTFLLYGALGGALFFMPFALIQVGQYSPTRAGAVLLPFVFLMVVLSRWAGGLLDRFGAKTPLVIGTVVVALGYGVFSVTDVRGSYVRSVLPAVLLLGFGMSVCVAPLTSAVMGAVDERQAGLASGINNAVARTAALIAVAAMGALLAFWFRSDLEGRLAPLPIGPELRSRVMSAGVSLLERIPEGVPDAASERLVDAGRQAFLFAYHRVMAVAAFLCLGASACAAIGVEGRKR